MLLGLLVVLCIFFSTHCLNTVCKKMRHSHPKVFHRKAFIMCTLQHSFNILNSYTQMCIITEDTSKGSIKIINREKYQAINTETVTMIWCRNTFPYLKSKVPANRNATMISVKNAPRTILSFISISSVIFNASYDFQAIVKLMHINTYAFMSELASVSCASLTLISASLCIFSNFSKVTDLSGINFGLQSI